MQKVFTRGLQCLVNKDKAKINKCLLLIKTIILPVVLYGCEAWPLTLKEKRRLRVFKNRILRRIFGSKGDVNGEWRKLHNEELHSILRQKVLHYQQYCHAYAQIFGLHNGCHIWLHIYKAKNIARNVAEPKLPKMLTVTCKFLLFIYEPHKIIVVKFGTTGPRYQVTIPQFEINAKFEINSLRIMNLDILPTGILNVKLSRKRSIWLMI